MAGTFIPLLFALTLSAFAQETQQSEAYRASMAQSDVKRDTAAIEAGLIEIRDQMRQLMPEDVGTVDAAIRRIRELSREEMDAAVAALQEASRSTDAKLQTEKIAGALRNQSTVSTALKQLSVNLQAKESMASLAKELTNLVRRQVSTYLEIARLGRIHQVPEDLRNQHQERYQVANEDQKVISADLNLLLRKMDQIGKDFEGHPENALVQAAAVAVAGNLGNSADQATQLTTTGPFREVAPVQEQILRTLVKMQQELASENNPLDKLRAASARLKHAAEDQKEIVNAVQLIGERQDLKRDEKRLQASLGDEVVAVRFEIEPLNNLATDQLLATQEAIDKSLLNFIRMWEEHMDARVNTQEAQRTLDAAIVTLSNLIAQLEKDTPESLTALAAQLDQLQREVATAAMQQAQTARQPLMPQSPQIQAMRDRVNNFQQRAVAISPAAAGLLAAAANQVPTVTPAAQMEAAQKLAEASRELLKQKNEVAALAQAGSEIAQAEDLIEKAQENLEDNKTAQATNQLKAALEKAAAAEKATKNSAPEAAEALAEAGEELEKANMDAAQTKAEEAGEKAAAAAEALAKAEAGIQEAMARQPGMAQIAMKMGAGTEISAENQGNGPQIDSEGNGGTGPTGDNLTGAGDIGGPVEVLTGLTPQDREAVAAFQSEKPPHEYLPAVQQYYKNIADGAGL